VSWPREQCGRATACTGRVPASDLRLAGLATALAPPGVSWLGWRLVRVGVRGRCRQLSHDPGEPERTSDGIRARDGWRAVARLPDRPRWRLGRMAVAGRVPHRRPGHGAQRHGRTHTWETVADGAWSQWQSLGGVITALAAVNQGWCLELFARGTDNALWHNVQAPPGPVAGWLVRSSGQVSQVTLAGPGCGGFPALVRHVNGKRFRNVPFFCCYSNRKQIFKHPSDSQANNRGNHRRLTCNAARGTSPVGAAPALTLRRCGKVT
jgi:hypothetical protein